MVDMVIMDIIACGRTLFALGRFRRLISLSATCFLLLVASSSWAGSITIGQTSVQTTADGNNANLLLAQSATLSQAATIQSLSFYVTAAAGKLVLGIYDNTGTGGSPGKLLASTGSFTPKVGWNTQAVTSPVALVPGTYWLAYFPNDNGLSFVIGHSGKNSIDPTTFSGSMPSKFTQSSTANWSWSFYATLSTAAPTFTIGQTSVLTTADGGNGNLLLAQTATLSQTATIQSLSFYVTAAAGNLVLGIYDSVNGAPGQLLASSGAFTPVVGWNTQPTTKPVALAAGTYWLAYLPSNSGLSFVIGSGSGYSGNMGGRSPDLLGQHAKQFRAHPVFTNRRMVVLRDASPRGNTRSKSDPGRNPDPRTNPYASPGFQRVQIFRRRL